MIGEEKGESEDRQWGNNKGKQQQIACPSALGCNTIYNALIFTLFAGSCSMLFLPHPLHFLRQSPAYHSASTCTPANSACPSCNINENCKRPDTDTCELHNKRTGKRRQRTHGHGCTFIYRQGGAGSRWQGEWPECRQTARQAGRESFSRIGQYF